MNPEDFKGLDDSLTYQPDTDYPTAADYTRLLDLLDRGMSKGYASLDGDDCAILRMALCAFIQLDKGETDAG